MKHRADTTGGPSGWCARAIALFSVLLSAVPLAWAQADGILNHDHAVHQALPDTQPSDNRATQGADARQWRERVYGLLAQGRHSEALEAAEQAHRLNPLDQQMALQRAYLLDTAGRSRLATEAFRVLTRSADAAIAAAACQGWQALRGQPDKVLPHPWFAEVYAAPEHVSRYELGIFPWALRLGQGLGGPSQLAVYGSVRVTTDTRSGETVLGPQMYNGNAAIVAAGVRGRPVADWPMQLFAELGVAQDLIERQRDRTRGDLRAGLVFSQAWNSAPRCAAQAAGQRFLGDVYADAIYHSRYSDAVLFNVRARPGLRLVESDRFALDAYALLAAGTDTKPSAQNRYTELGAGLALTVFEPWRLSVRAEAVQVQRHDNRTRYHTGRWRLEYGAAF